MDDQIIDARGLACPQPVILTKKALDAEDEGFVTTVVDNTSAVENLTRLARVMGCGVEVEQIGDEYHVRIEKIGAGPEPIEHNQSVILVKNQFLGEGNDELGRILMNSFMYTLTQMEGTVGSIIFMNSGVVLTVSGSEVLEHLRLLEQSGVEILVCGTCLDFYQIKNQLGVGHVSNMYTIYEKMAAAYRVITL